MLDVKKLFTKLTQSASALAKYLNGNNTAIANYNCNNADAGALFLSTGATNAPTGFTWFVLITFLYYSGLKIQIAIDMNGNSSIRGWNGSSWSTWKRTANTEEYSASGSFSGMPIGYVRNALDTIRTNIGSYNNGVYNVGSGSGPQYQIRVGKYSASYWSAIATTYATSDKRMYLAKYENGTCYVKVIG